MSVATTSNHRRRSQSATSSPGQSRSVEHSWRKRSHPHHTCGSTSPGTQRQSWRRKRPRRDGNTSDESIDLDVDQPFMLASSPAPTFSANAADFHLFSSRQRASTSPRQTASAPLAPPTELDMKRLRADAFWELRRSIAESGDGLVSRMRDYEHSRSRADAYSKVKDAHNRGRKRSSIQIPVRNSVALLAESDDDSDDDVQIFSGDPSIFLLSDISRQKKRPASWQADVSQIQPEHSRSQSLSDRGSSSYGSTSSTSAYPSDDENIPFSLQFPSRNPQLTPESSSLSPVLSFLPSNHPPNMVSSRTEKALAALSLTMMNGGCSINDYDGLFPVQHTAEDSHVGELWH